MVPSKEQNSLAPKAMLILVLCSALLAVPEARAQGQADPASRLGEQLGHPGYLIITAGRDSTAGFQWLEGPGPDQISLTWLDGMLTLPDSLTLEPFGERDLAVPVTGSFAGAGAGGKLRWQDGTFTISEPVLLTDGLVQLLASAGELEVLATRIRYRAPEATAPRDGNDLRASLMMLAGIALLIAVLLRRARRKLKKDL
jgi:hypothetical protein